MNDPLELSDALITSGLRAGFKVLQYGSESVYPLLALHRAGPSGAPRVYISSGAHGDEPAPVHALRQLIVSEALPATIDFTLCPIINPVGFAAGTRENANGIDLNRDFKLRRSMEVAALIDFLEKQKPFDLSMCLHEDWEANGFYTYYLGGNHVTKAAEKIIQEVAKVGSIETMDIIDGREARNGIVHPPDGFDPHLLDDWPEAFYLLSKAEHPHFTFETPSGRPLEERIPMQITAVTTAINHFYG